MKTCIECQVEKEDRKFYPKWDRCMSCNFGGGTTEEKRQRTRNVKKAWYDKFKKEDPVGYKKYVMHQSAKSRAKQWGLPFDLTLEDIVIPEFCPALGIKLELSGSRNAPHPASPSLDKIVPSLGYVKGNVVVVSMLANQIKSSATADQIMQVAEYYKKLTTP